MKKQTGINNVCDRQGRTNSKLVLKEILLKAWINIPQKECTQGITRILIELHRMKSHIHILNEDPEFAKDLYFKTWNKQISGNSIIKTCAKSKVPELKGCF